MPTKLAIIFETPNFRAAFSVSGAKTINEYWLYLANTSL